MWNIKRAKFTLCDVVAVRLTLEMGYKEINGVVYIRGDTWQNIEGCHEDVPPEMAPAPILSCQLSNINLNSITKPLEGHWYRQGNSRQQLLCQGDIAPSVDPLGSVASRLASVNIAWWMNTQRMNMSLPTPSYAQPIVKLCMVIHLQNQSYSHSSAGKWPRPANQSL